MKSEQLDIVEKEQIEKREDALEQEEVYKGIDLGLEGSFYTSMCMLRFNCIKIYSRHYISLLRFYIALDKILGKNVDTRFVVGGTPMLFISNCRDKCEESDIADDGVVWEYNLGSVSGYNLESMTKDVQAVFKVDSGEGTPGVVYDELKDKEGNLWYDKLLLKLRMTNSDAKVLRVGDSLFSNKVLGISNQSGYISNRALTSDVDVRYLYAKSLHKNMTIKNKVACLIGNVNSNYRVDVEIDTCGYVCIYESNNCTLTFDNCTKLRLDGYYMDTTIHLGKGVESAYVDFSKQRHNNALVIDCLARNVSLKLAEDTSVLLVIHDCAVVDDIDASSLRNSLNRIFRHKFLKIKCSKRVRKMLEFYEYTFGNIFVDLGR